MMPGANWTVQFGAETFETFVSALTYEDCRPEFARTRTSTLHTGFSREEMPRKIQEKLSAVSLGKYGLARMYNPCKLPRSILHRVALPCRYVPPVLFDMLISTDAVSEWHFADKRSSPWESLWIPVGRLCGFRVAGVDYNAWLGSLCIRGLKFSRVELDGSENWSFEGKVSDTKKQPLLGISIC